MFRIEDLAIELQIRYMNWVAECKLEGLDARVTEGFRSPAREDQLHAEGITKATSQTCYHCHMDDGKPASRAFDFACYDNGKYIKDGTHPYYKQAGEIAEALGLEWGGRWPHPDWDHIQLISNP